MFAQSSQVHATGEKLAQEEQCQYIMRYNFDGFDENQRCTREMNFKSSKQSQCRNTTQCPMKTRITKIKHWAQVAVLDTQISNMMSKCCGDCSYDKVEVDDINDVLSNNSTLLKSSDIIYPVFGLQSSTQLYGFWFIPVMEVPPGLYIVKRKSPVEITTELVMNIVQLWPLLVILLTFAVLAGFVMWLFENWTNPKEFSQSFAVGMLDGFWLAYVSMTTGDVFIIYMPNNRLLMEPY